MDGSVFDYAYKKGEVVVPAGGETGGPHCLAEVYKLLKKQRYILNTNRKNLRFQKIPSNEKYKSYKIIKGFISTPNYLNTISIHVMVIKCKLKIAIFSIFFAQSSGRPRTGPQAG